MQVIDYPGFLYGLLVAGGGLQGYISKGSTTSLAAGLGFGALILIAAYRVSRDPKAFRMIFGLSVTLAGVMGYRFLKTKKFMPAGLVFIISFFFAVRYATNFYLLGHAVKPKPKPREKFADKKGEKKGR